MSKNQIAELRAKLAGVEWKLAVRETQLEGQREFSREAQNRMNQLADRLHFYQQAAAELGAHLTGLERADVADLLAQIERERPHQP